MTSESPEPPSPPVGTTAVRSPVPRTSPGGLSAGEVAERVASGRTNASQVRTSRPVLHIVRANVLTPFNGLLAALFVVIAITGRWQNALSASSWSPTP